MSRADRASTPVPDALTVQSWHQTQLAYVGTILVALRVAAGNAATARYVECCLFVAITAHLLASVVHLRVYQPRSFAAITARARRVVVGLAALAALFMIPGTIGAPIAPRRAPSSHGVLVILRAAPTQAESTTGQSQMPRTHRTARRRLHQHRVIAKR